MKRALLVLLFAFVWVGCSDSTGPEAVSGRYELRTVNGGNLPYTFLAIGNNRLEILSGFAQINANNTFSTSLTSRTTTNGQSSTTTDTDSGTWTQTGNQMQFTHSDRSVSTGVVNNDEITVIEDDISFVFRK